MTTVAADAYEQSTLPHCDTEEMFRTHKKKQMPKTSFAGKSLAEGSTNMSSTEQSFKSNVSKGPMKLLVKVPKASSQEVLRSLIGLLSRLVHEI